MLILAILMGVAAVIVLQLQAGGSATVFSVTANRAPGETLKGAYKKVALPRKTFEPMSGSVLTAELEDMVANMPIVRPVRAGALVTSDLFSTSIGIDVDQRITAGMRAIGLEVTGPKAVGFLIRPGDLVDVLATLPQGERMVSKYLLQAKKVMAVDQHFREEDSALVGKRGYSTVTLEVTPEEAEKVEASRAFVRDGFTLALRRPDDPTRSAVGAVEVGSPEFDRIGNE